MENAPESSFGLWTERLRWRLCVVLGLVCTLWNVAHAESPPELRVAETIRPDGIHVLDGSYVLDMGELDVNITNHGLIGSQYTQTYPYSRAPSGQWPGGSGHEYLWGAGLWIGGSISGQLSVTTGQPQRELRPGSQVFETIYEAREGRVVRPVPNDQVTGRRRPDSGADDDHDGQIDEDFLNGWDDDRDGLVDEDFGQIGSQMFTCTMYDDTGLVRELYPDHAPLGVAVVQRAAAFYQDEYEDIVILDFEVSNQGYREIKDLYLGMYVDCDIQDRGAGGSNPDDLAGFYDGVARDSNNSFHRLQIGWMKDAAASDPLPGVFGTILLGHDTDPLRYYAPNMVGVNSYQIFATNATTAQGGEPVADDARYGLMARTQIDRDRRIDQPGDLKFMMSSGPFGNLPPGRKVTYRVGLVVGNGMGGMLRNALKISEIHRGRYVDADRNWQTGSGGRERKVCLGDYPTYENGEDRLLDFRVNFVDEECTGPDPVIFEPIISKDAMWPDEEGRYCMYVNADNCEECFRHNGVECTLRNRLFYTSRYRQLTGTGGRETNVPWVFPGDYPPQPPSVRIVPGDNSAEIFWDDLSEFDLDPDTGVADFESYRVWRVADWDRPDGSTDLTGPASALWGMIQEYDLRNFISPTVSPSSEELPLGRNTGLEDARYTPVCLGDPQYEGLAVAMQTFVDSDRLGRFLTRPPLRDSRGAVIPGRESLVPWEASPTVLDTFFAVTSRLGAPPPERTVPKRGARYYHYFDTQVHNGFQTYYSVVATDHALQWDGSAYLPSGFGMQSDPGNSQQFITPGPLSQTASLRQQDGVNIYAYPNPATREALAEFQKKPPSGTDPTGERIMFNNLPDAHNIVKIYSASGDLIQTLDHDGTTGEGAVSWNLVSRNGQEVVSGIYLFSVESDDARFEDFRGKFVIIR